MVTKEQFFGILLLGFILGGITIILDYRDDMELLEELQWEQEFRDCLDFVEKNKLDSFCIKGSKVGNIIITHRGVVDSPIWKMEYERTEDFA